MVPENLPGRVHPQTQTHPLTIYTPTTLSTYQVVLDNRNAPPPPPYNTHTQPTSWVHHEEGVSLHTLPGMPLEVGRDTVLISH